MVVFSIAIHCPVKRRQTSNFRAHATSFGEISFKTVIILFTITKTQSEMSMAIFFRSRIVPVSNKRKYNLFESMT